MQYKEYNMHFEDFGERIICRGARLLSTSNKISLLVYFQTLEAKKKNKK